VRGQGLKVSLTPLPYAQPIGRRRLAHVWDRQLRWSRVRRDGFPLVFATEFSNGSVLPVAAMVLAGAVLNLPVAGVLAYVGLWYGAEIYLMRRAAWPHGWRDMAVLPLRDLLLPALWAATFLRRGIEWRGTAMAAPADAAELEEVTPQ
jgi:ceramide glucosyltransferase